MLVTKQKNIYLCRLVQEEFLVYDLSSLSGDVGGMVGMLLGASALAVFDAAKEAASWIANKLKE